MEGGPQSGGPSGSAGSLGPQTLASALEELQGRLQETLAVLSPQELRSFRVILKTVDEEPRVSPLALELEGGSASGLARLLAKHYYLPSAARVLTKVLRRLRRADLLSRWQCDAAADSQVIPRKILKRSYDYVADTLDCYDLSGKRKTFLMCVKKDRPGAHRDIRLMKDWLGQCQFECTPCIDPDKTEFLRNITAFRDGLNEMKDEIGCCLITLMSHGEKGFIKINDEKVSLEDIFEMFNNRNCPALQEKPKIFIIQACRGGKRDSGIETDDEPMELDDVSRKKRLPTYSDCLIIYPTQPDHVALRHRFTGSVMIKAMAETFKLCGNQCHLVDFFTKVNSRVVHTDFWLQEQPVKISLVMESTLTRSVYF